jgi:hypothetical protein
MTDPDHPDRRPPGAEELLQKWPEQPRSDADFERMARAIEARIAHEVLPGDEGSSADQGDLNADKATPHQLETDQLETDQLETTVTRRTERGRRAAEDRDKAGGHRSEDWLFRPPLPLQSGEPRHSPVTTSRSGTELSLKDIARAALEGNAAEASSPAPRPPLQSHVQQRRVPLRVHEDPGASQSPTAERHSQVNLVANRTRTAPGPSAVSVGPGAPESTAPPAGAQARKRPAAWWMWGAVAAAACLSLVIARDLVNPAAESVATNPTTVIVKTTVIPAAAPPVVEPAPERVTSAQPSAPSEEPVAEVASLDQLPVAKPKAAPRAAAARPTTSTPDAEGKALLQPESAAAEPALVPAASAAARPNRPSIGAAQGAVGAKLGTARACLAGSTVPSKAAVVFGSDGRVRSVTVSGPAKGTPAEGCIIKAMSGARLKPFADDSFTVRTTVRP